MEGVGIEWHHIAPGKPQQNAATAAPLIAHMAQDKKRTGGTLPFILTRGIGRAFVARDVALGDVAAFLERELGGG